MNVIPSTPTDNIYKFMAISGLWFVVGFIALYIWLVNTQVQLDKERLKSQAYFLSVNMERGIQNRLNAILAHKPAENRLGWVPTSWTLEQEAKILSIALENHQETIRKNKDVLESRTGEGLLLLERWDVRIAGALYISLMVGLTYFGFSRWFAKTHLVDEELRNIDRDIKLKSLEKTALEIKQLKLAIRSTLRLRHRAR